MQISEGFALHKYRKAQKRPLVAVSPISSPNKLVGITFWKTKWSDHIEIINPSIYRNQQHHRRILARQH